MQRARRPGPTVRTRVRVYDAGQVRDKEDRLATEEPLEVRLAWPGVPARRVAVTMRTPGQDFELAVGLLHAEGALSPDLLRTVAYCTDADLTDEQELNVVTVTLDGPPPRPPLSRGDTVVGSASACGVCGADSISDVLALTATRADAPDVRVGAETLLGLTERMRAQQRVFDSTGGLHAAGLFDADGELLVLREDVGRHNAVDKTVGSRLLSGQPLSVPVMCVSSRLGFEIVQKAVAAGIGVVAAIGAPSSLAVDLARRSGLGLVGFLGPQRFVVYAGHERVGV